MNVASTAILAIAFVWAVLLIAMYLDHRAKMKKIKAVEDKINAGAEKAEANRAGNIIPRTTLQGIDIEPGDEMKIEHDYMDACAHVAIIRSEGTREHFAIDMDDEPNIARMNLLMAKARHQRRQAEGTVNAFNRPEFLELDARARANGLNVDRTVRRETIPVTDAVARARNQANAQIGTLDSALKRRVDRGMRDRTEDYERRKAEEQRRRDDTYDPLVVLPTVYEREEPKPSPTACIPEPERLVPRADPIMDGGGFRTGGSFGGESFSTGSDSGSSSSSSSDISSSSSSFDSGSSSSD